MIKIKVSGNFNKTEKFLSRNKKMDFKVLNKYAKNGVQSLASATPVDTGFTAASWYYDIEKTADSTNVVWKNSNIVDGVPIAVILQYGHATRNGGYVPGTDYIMPALSNVMDSAVDAVWKEVTKG